MSRDWSGVGGITIALVALGSCSYSGDRLSEDAVAMCEHPLRFPFDAEVFDFGDRFGETDGDTVLSVIAESESVGKPPANDVVSALESSFDLVGEVEDDAFRDWFLSLESRETGCRFSVSLISDSSALELRGFERSWMLVLVERSPETQVFLND